MKKFYKYTTTAFLGGFWLCVVLFFAMGFNPWWLLAAFGSLAISLTSQLIGNNGCNYYE